MTKHKAPKAKHIFTGFHGFHNLMGLSNTTARNASVCDWYSNQLFGASNATTQYTLMTALVNTAVIGNYSQDSKVAVPGILAQDATYNGTKVNLLPYFDGSMDTTNQGGDKGVKCSFLDGGGAAPLKENKPADNETSNQYQLLTHLYELFGVLLECSDMGEKAFPSYAGDSSLYETHKFMELDAAQVGYFIEQVGLSAQSFGVDQNDIDDVGQGLMDIFGYRCSAAVAIAPNKTKELQAICIAADCPKSSDATKGSCKAYHNASEPMDGSGGGNKSEHGSENGTTSGSPGSSGSQSPSQTGSAVRLGLSMGTVLSLIAMLAVFMG